MNKIPDNSDLPDDDSDGWEEEEFIRCEQCDYHDACEDFGCAIALGLRHLVKKEFTADDL